MGRVARSLKVPPVLNQGTGSVWLCSPQRIGERGTPGGTLSAADLRQVEWPQGSVHAPRLDNEQCAKNYAVPAMPSTVSTR